MNSITLWTFLECESFTGNYISVSQSFLNFQFTILYIFLLESSKNGHCSFFFRKEFLTPAYWNSTKLLVLVPNIHYMYKRTGECCALKCFIFQKQGLQHCYMIGNYTISILKDIGSNQDLAGYSLYILL